MTMSTFLSPWCDRSLTSSRLLSLAADSSHHVLCQVMSPTSLVNISSSSSWGNGQNNFIPAHALSIFTRLTYRPAPDLATSNGPKTFDFCPDGSPDIQRESGKTRMHIIRGTLVKILRKGFWEGNPFLPRLDRQTTPRGIHNGTQKRRTKQYWNLHKRHGKTSSQNHQKIEKMIFISFGFCS